MIAESARTVRVEGNHYFPIDDVDRSYLRSSTTHTRCPWKGTASYYTIAVDGELLSDGAWYYPKPSPAAGQIAGHVAFWRGVKVERVRDSGPAQAAADGLSERRSMVARLLGRR